MSFKMLSWAWKQDLDPQAKLVLLFLADSHNGNDGRCHPSVSAIAKATGLCVRTVRSRLRDLEGRRLIATQSRQFTNTATASNTYVLNPPACGADRHEVPGLRHAVPGLRQLRAAPIDEPEENLEENLRGFRERRDLSEGGDLSLDVELNGKGRGSVGKPNGQASTRYSRH